MATDFFEKYPKLLYTLDNNRTGQLVPDLFRRVAIVDEIKKISSYYDLYDIKDGETPEILADIFYNDTTLHWVILKTNDIVDPRFEWVLPYPELVKNAIQKYGGPEFIHEIHHADGYSEELDQFFQQDTNFILAPETTDINNPIRVIFQGQAGVARTPLSHKRNPKISRLMTNLEYEEQENEKRRRIKILKPAIVNDIVNNLEVIINR